MKSSIWIDKEYKSYYCEERNSGIALYMDVDLPERIVVFVPKITDWLRKKYYFPIRCSVFVRNAKQFLASKEASPCKGVFFAPAEQTKEVPQIYIAAKSLTTHEFAFTLLHELTHYYQWYFLEDERRTSRSLEIEANRYADYLCDLFAEQTGYEE